VGAFTGRTSHIDSIVQRFSHHWGSRESRSYIVSPRHIIAITRSLDDFVRLADEQALNGTKKLSKGEVFSLGGVINEAQILFQNQSYLANDTVVVSLMKNDSTGAC
jgi:hypothetical protein